MEVETKTFEYGLFENFTTTCENSRAEVVWRGSNKLYDGELNLLECDPLCTWKLGTGGHGSVDKKAMTIRWNRLLLKNLDENSLKLLHNFVLIHITGRVMTNWTDSHQTDIWMYARGAIWRSKIDPGSFVLQYGIDFLREGTEQTKYKMLKSVSEILSDMFVKKCSVVITQ